LERGEGRMKNCAVGQILFQCVLTFCDEGALLNDGIRASVLFWMVKAD
jgi:hypothetical protein